MKRGQRSRLSREDKAERLELVKDSFKKGKGKERADMSDEVDGVSRGSHGNGEKEGKSEEALEEMVEVRRANHESGGDKLEEESGDNFKLK